MVHYLCLLDGVVEYSSNSWNEFEHYQMVYAEEHENQPVTYLTLTDEEYDQFFAMEDEEECDE